MKTTTPPVMRLGMWLLTCVLVGAWLLALVLAPSARAQAAATGLITGRVFNPATGEYVRNVEIRIEGTQQVAISEEGGRYRLPNAPVGPVTLAASYAGHTAAPARLTVTAGATVTHDFELSSMTGPAAGEAVKLDAFVVSTEREGQAKAIMEQKNAMNVKTVVAADNFGNITEANVGEFLKYMPGVTLDYVETDTRAARLSGMEARYGYVTLDGNTMANVNTGGFGADTRQFEYEAISINNIESIEVNKTLSADMPADAPAGTVNLRTKSALNRKGAQFNYTLGFIANQYEHSFNATPRHDDSRHTKARPTGNFDYSNSFLDHKLGVSVNGSSSNVFKEQFRHSMSYDYTSATAIARGRPVITGLNFKDGPKMGEKNSGGLKLDYEPFKALRLSLTSSYTMFQDEIANRNLNFVVGVTDTDPSSTLTKVIANPSGANANTRIDQTGNNGSKKNETTNLALSFTYKDGPWTVDGGGGYSRARGQNGSEHMGMVEAANIRLTRIGWTAERPSADSAAWTFTQTSGPDWYNFDNYGKFDAQANNITTSRSRGKTEQFVGQLNAQRAMNWKLPTTFKAGVYDQVTTRFRETFLSTVSTFVGAGNNQLTAAMPLSIADFRIAVPWDSNIRPLPVPDKTALHLLLKSHPEYFLTTPANIATGLDNTLGSRASNQEQILATYFMQTTRVGQWQLQGGVRAEETHTISKAKAAVPIARNPFAIVTTNATTGVKTYTAAATPEYMIYKWRNDPEADYGTYRDYLPSASAKYTFSRDLFLKLGYNKAIKRPNLNNIAGPWSLNAAETQITVPNADLKPERSEKFSAMVEYYFEPSGTVSVHVFQTQIKNAADTVGPISAADFGLANDPDYGAFEFITFVNNPGVRTIKGIEVSYSQQFTFLPWEVLKGTTVFFNYARFTSNPRPIQFINGAGWAPQNASGGISYRYKKFNASLSGQWVDEAFIAGALTSAIDRGQVQVLDDRVTFDLNLGYKVTKHTSVFVAARNAFNAGKKWYFKEDGRMQMREKYGGQWTAGITGKY